MDRQNKTNMPLGFYQSWVPNHIPWQMGKKSSRLDWSVYLQHIKLYEENRTTSISTQKVYWKQQSSNKIPVKMFNNFFLYSTLYLWICAPRPDSDQPAYLTICIRMVKGLNKKGGGLVKLNNLFAHVWSYGFLWIFSRAITLPSLIKIRPYFPPLISSYNAGKPF